MKGMPVEKLQGASLASILTAVLTIINTERFKNEMNFA